ncbi:MAG: hypothetical protein KC503_15455 [Myxococcales bacterium]|nr:hypothetical protein [Myxococcales bacterium]
MRLRALWRLVVLAPLVVGACSDSHGAPSDGGVNERSSGEGITFSDGPALDAPADGDVAAPDLPPPDAPAQLPDVSSCSPDEFIGCHAGTTLLRCNSSGDGLVMVSCAPYLCNAKAQRCNLCDPATPPTCNGVTRESCSGDGERFTEQCQSGCLAGDCVGCTPLTYYRDTDGDSYGDPATGVSLCTPPTSGYVTDSTDCDDSDAKAHPGQTQFSSTPRKGGGYDFDCDGNETQENTDLFTSCPTSGTVGCPTPPAWEGAVPACGDPGTLSYCQRILFSSCRKRSNPGTQACR